uniref:Uncharacterized protein n=1 Tax=Kalanchoe fedtschenkoi TaxID=63787 RepID=A0A7N0ZYY6_KALFE
MPKDCILFGPSWESVQRIAMLPFLDEKYCGESIHSYEDELKKMGVVTEFRDGSHLVAAGLRLPKNPSIITSKNMVSLLECVKILLQKGDSLSNDFLNKVSGKWIRTHAGYQSPDRSLLFNSKWGSLNCTDGPFIDEQFYGSKINSYADELKAIGVIVGVNHKGSDVMASYLPKISDFSKIVRVYTFLNENNWKSSNKSADQIWIPDACGEGHWVSPSKCVLQDNSGLFGSQLFVLKKHYKRELLLFFASAYEVKQLPSLDDCFALWQTWETSVDSLPHDDCLAFWKNVLRWGSSKVGSFFGERLCKLPAHSVNSDEVMLRDMGDVFLPDDLNLKQLFEQSSSDPIFVWCPRSDNEFRTSLLEVYHKIKVKLLSEHVVSEELPSTNGVELKSVSPSEYFIRKELLMLILSYLAQSSSKMSSQARHEAVRPLLDLKVRESAEPITATYTLKLQTSGKTLTAKASRMVRWDKDSSTLFVQKMDSTDELRFALEYATYFSTVISEGVIWNHEELITGLSDLLKLGFLLKFDGEAIKFLMMNKNLQIFPEDEVFLSSAFPSC